MNLFGSLRLNARAGVLQSSGNDALPSLARSAVSFADVSIGGNLFQRWTWQVQYDAHSSLYRDSPPFLGEAGLFTLAVRHPFAARSELTLGITEDFPIGHTQDVSLLAAYRQAFD